MPKEARTIGIAAKPPKKICSDDNCPWDGSLKVRGSLFEGKIVTTKMDKSVVIRKDYFYLVKKYDRYENSKKRSHRSYSWLHGFSNRG